jgi:hypothetical protein
LNLRGGGPKIEPIPDENPKEAQIADNMAEELVCPISLHLMIDPVFISSGKTFDRTSIMNEFSRQREINPRGILFCPVTKEPLTDVLTPNLQMRSITEKFFYQYKDVPYRGSTWDEIRRICGVYQEEQTSEKIKERRRIHEIENAKRADERKKTQEQQDQKIQEMERRLQEKNRLIQEMERGLQERERLIEEKRNYRLYIRRLESGIEDYENEMRSLQLLLIEREEELRAERQIRQEEIAREEELRTERQIREKEIAREEEREEQEREREESERIERERRGEVFRQPIRQRDMDSQLSRSRSAELRSDTYTRDPAFWALVREIERESGSHLRR